jgi:peptide/nickel transport system permease protein
MIQLTAFRRYLVKRLVYVLLTLFLISFIVFAVTQLLPGNAAKMMLGEFATEEAVAAIEKDLGLNRPWYVQYGDWLGSVLVGDLGRSYIMKTEVDSLLWQRFINSAHLAGLTFFFVIVLAIPLGTIAAVGRDTWIDSLFSLGAYVGLSLPNFVVGILLILLLGGPVFEILPSSGRAPLSDGVIEWFRHLLLPMVSLLLVVTAHVMRQTRSSMIEALQSDYVRTARLKGLSKWEVVVKHALRNGLLPAITVLALNLGYLMGGIVVVEEVFAYPGIGRLVVRAITNRDLPVIQACVLVIAATYTLANFAADIVYTYLDPRIEYGGG